MIRSMTPLLLAAALLGGCASAPKGPTALNPEKSFALNLASRAGISEGLKDMEVPGGAQDVSRLTDSGAFGAAFAAGGALSSLTTGGLNLLLWATSPSVPSAHNRVLAWMPRNLAANKEEARDKLDSMINQAVTETLDEMGYPYEVDRFEFDKSSDNAAWQTRYILTDYEACLERNADFCDITVATLSPDKSWTAPIELGGHQAWLFSRRAAIRPMFGTGEYYWTGEGKKFRSITKSVHQNIFPELEFMQRVSAKLPKWAALYNAPGKVASGPGVAPDGIMRFPSMVHQGQMHLFIKPEAPAAKQASSK